MYRTHVSCIIDAPVAKVWDAIRPFDSLSNWHAAIATSNIEGQRPSDQLGSTRRLEIVDGGVVREVLVELSDRDRRVVYSIVESPMPVENYFATIELHEVTEGNKTFARWEVEFDTAEGTRDEMIETLQGIFRTGFEGLQKLFA